MLRETLGAYSLIQLAPQSKEDEKEEVILFAKIYILHWKM